MTHLDPTQFVDLLEGKGSSSTVGHLDGCEHCRSQLSSLRSAMAAVSMGEAPDPSPLFWDHFARRVNDRIDAPAVGVMDWARRSRLTASLAAVAVLFLLAIGARTLHVPSWTPGVATSAPGGSGPGEERILPQLSVGDEPRDDVESDGAWAVVRTAAQDLAYEDAKAEGIAPRPGSVEIAVLEMSNEERAELARLIEDELKRTGT